jgi:F420-dependent oxidoreductase-like protein
MPLAYAGDFLATVDGLRDFENVGVDIVLLPEAYGFDSVSQLGYIAAKTSRIQLCSSILNIYSRTPTLLAMTAAGLDYVSEGRFVLGLGASGPQVVEGFHGVPHGRPLARTREVIEICRATWRRERIDFHGDHFDIPLSADLGTGLGKPLKLINHPVRDRVPTMLAALGPKNVELAAELFEAWEPIFYFPERAEAAFGQALAAGTEMRPSDLPPLEVTADTRLLVSDNPDEIAAAMDDARQHLALYIGGMGARGRNFYHQLAGRFGFSDEADQIQEHYLAGRKAEAAASVPDELVRGTTLIGDRDWVAHRVAAFAAAGVTTVNALPLAATHERRLGDVSVLVDLASGHSTTTAPRP